MSYHFELDEHPVVNFDTPWGKNSFLDGIYPLAENQIKFPHRFLAECCLNKESREPLLCMDGLLLLKRFFKRVPAPRNDREILVLPGDFSLHVPEAWARNTIAFDFTLNRKPETLPVRTVLIGGVFHPSVTDPLKLSAIFGELKRELSRRFPDGWPLIEFMFAFRNSPWLGEPPYDFANRIISSFYFEFGPTVRPVTWSKINSTGSFEDVLFFDLNDRMLCSSSSFQLQIMSKGGIPLLPSAQMIKFREGPAADLFYIPFSQYSGAGVRLNDLRVHSSLTETLVNYWRRDYPSLALWPTIRSSRDPISQEAAPAAQYS